MGEAGGVDSGRLPSQQCTKMEIDTASGLALDHRSLAVRIW